MPWLLNGYAHESMVVGLALVAIVVGVAVALRLFARRSCCAPFSWPWQCSSSSLRPSPRAQRLTLGSEEQRWQRHIRLRGDASDSYRDWRSSGGNATAPRGNAPASRSRGARRALDARSKCCSGSVRARRNGRRVSATAHGTRRVELVVLVRLMVGCNGIMWSGGRWCKRG